MASVNTAFPQTENITNGTILTEDVASGGNDKVLVTDNTGTVQWIDKTAFGAVADLTTIEGTIDHFNN